MKLATKIIAALVIGAASTSAAYAGWEQVNENFSWNTDRLQISGKHRTTFVRQTEPGNLQSGKRYASVIISQTFDCESLATRLNSAAFYDGQDKVVHAEQFSLNGQFEATYPDSVGEKIAKSVCARAG